jgi:hypothetical protein
MRVQFQFSDKVGEYDVTAEVNPINHNKIQIVTIRDENGIELSMDDFDVEEQRGILWEAKQEAEILDRMPDEDVEDDEYDNFN